MPAAFPSWAIEAEDLGRSFGPVRALGGVSFAVRPGEISGVLGPNGSLVLLVVGLMASQATGVLMLTPLAALALGAGLWALDAALLALAIKTFSRSELISRL